jgi:hypothetical protein
VLPLIHGPDLPAPLAELSPWLDHLVNRSTTTLPASTPHRTDG